MLTVTSSHVKGILCTKAVEESMSTMCFSRHSFDSFPRAKTMLSNLFKSFGWMSFSSSGFQCQLGLKIWVACIYKPGHVNLLTVHPGAPPCNVDMAAWAPAVVKVACIPEASMSDKYNDHTCGSDVSWSNQRSQRIWLTQAKWQTIYLDMVSKWWLAHESKKYYRPNAAWRGRNNPFCHPFCPPSLQLLKSNQKSAWHIWHNCGWGCRSAMRSQSSNMKENVTISSTYIYIQHCP